MIPKNICLLRKFLSTFSVSKTKKMNINKCYFRHVHNDEEKIDISFLMQVKDSVRQFNFSRNPTETLQNLLVRIQTNVQKVIVKSNKKKGNKEVVIEVKCYDSNTTIPESTTCKDLFALKGPVKLQVHESEYEIVFNAPWVVNITLPQSILAGFPIYPEHLVTLFTEKCNYVWYKGASVNENGKQIADIHINWIPIGSGFSYTPKADDVGMKLKLECTPVNAQSTGPTVQVVSKNRVEAGPGICPFEHRHNFTTKKLEGKSFRCVSYNILADLYADSDYTRTVLHPYCPPYALHIDYRKQLIIKELLGYNADIICLQEVDRKIFVNCLQPSLGLDGLVGSFHKKGKEVTEGLACFYRKDRFEKLEDHTILLSKAIQTNKCLEGIWNTIKDNQPLVERLLDRSTIASVSILKSHDNPDEIVAVGNTHLYFHPDSDHIRLVQGGIVIYWLQDILRQLNEKNPDKRISLILCGDFNSVPSCGIYILYTTGMISNLLGDWKSNENEAIENLSLKQDIPLASACGTPQYTNFTSGFGDCLDYIYYDSSHLEVEQVVPFPSNEELQAHTALPSIVFPSDHIALISDLRFL